MSAIAPHGPGQARAANQLGYQLLLQQAASGLPHNRGSLGMDIERTQQITDDGLTFDIIRVKGVRRGSPGAQAGFRPGDQIVAVDGRVFANLAAFAGYIGSIPSGRAISVDYIPANGGPGTGPARRCRCGFGRRRCRSFGGDPGRPVHGNQGRHRRRRRGPVRLLRTRLLLPQAADAGHLA